DARLDRLAQTEGGNARGTFVYNSIADVQANRPSSFSRSFSSHDMVADVQTASLSLGDQWRAGDRVNVTYGVRVDGNAIGTALAYNGAVDSLLHVRTNYSPRDMALSPRA